MNIASIIDDAKGWQNRHDDIVDAYIEHREQLKALGLPKDRFTAARDLLRIVLIRARRRAA